MRPEPKPTKKPALEQGEPAVVFLTRTADAETTELQRLLALIGVPHLRIDADRLTPARIDLAAPTAFTIDGRTVTPTVTWTRRFWPSAMPRADTVVPALRRVGWSALAGYLAAAAPTALPGPNIGLLDQLTDAAAAGITVPATIVTTDPAAAVAAEPPAAARVSGDPLVMKLLDSHVIEATPGILDRFPAQILSRKTLTRIRPDTGLPLVIQQYIPHDTEYRIYTARGEVLAAFEVRKNSPQAIWSDPDSVDIREVKPPTAVATVATELATRWRLGYGAFDILGTKNGPVFLEVNTEGDWRWYERKAKARPVTRSLAVLLHDLHTAAGGTTRGRGGAVLSLLTG